jgi:hypothetical protein
MTLNQFIKTNLHSTIIMILKQLKFHDCSSFLNKA